MGWDRREHLRYCHESGALSKSEYLSLPCPDSDGNMAISCVPALPALSPEEDCGAPSVRIRAGGAPFASSYAEPYTVPDPWSVSGSRFWR